MVEPVGNCNIFIANIASDCDSSWIWIFIQPCHWMILETIACHFTWLALHNIWLHSRHLLGTAHRWHSAHWWHSTHLWHASHWLLHSWVALIRISELGLLHWLSVTWWHHRLLITHVWLLISHLRLTISWHCWLTISHWLLAIRLLHAHWCASHRRCSIRLLHSHGSSSHRWCSIWLLHAHWRCSVLTTLICTDMRSCIRISQGLCTHFKSLNFSLLLSNLLLSCILFSLQFLDFSTLCSFFSLQFKKLLIL